MIRVNQIKVSLSHSREDILYKTAKILRVAPEKILSWQIVKKSIDARKKPEIMGIYSVDVRVEAQDRVLRACKSLQVQA
ncbi:MAG: FAD-dependent oxidoreductase, partial [Lachnospiraceae bacterium]|nr:FAD-dependent oxidoreductase [Lachnospiraceae bacterium]